MKKPILVISTLTVISAAIVVTATSVPPMFLSRERKSEGNTYPLAGIHRLNLNLKFAQVHVTTGAGSVAECTVVRWAKKPASGAVRTWVQKGALVVTTSHGELTLTEPSNLLKDGSDTKGIHEEVTISLPKGLDLNVRVGAGTLDTQGSFHSVSSNLGYGELTAHLAPCPPGDSNFKVGAGNVRLELPQESNAKVAASVGVGNISGLPRSGGGHYLTRVGDSRTGIIGRGDSHIAIQVGAGDINLVTPGRASSFAKVESENHDAAQLFAQDLSRSSDTDMRELASQAKATSDDLRSQAKDLVRDAEIESDDAVSESVRGDVDDFKQEGDSQDGMTQKEKADLDRSLAAIGPAIEAAMKTVRPAIEKAMRDAKPAIERARREHRDAFRREMERVKPEVRKAMLEAQVEIERAMKEMNSKDMHDLDKHGDLKKLIENSLKAAREAMRIAMEESQKAMKDMKN